MVWFKVDDKFHSHPKRYHCTLAAIGLWTVAGSWCGDQEKGDGLVPAHMLTVFGGTRKHAAELVRAGLWVEVDGGWRFHDWTDRNPSEGEINEKREKARERMRRARERAREHDANVRANTSDGDGEVHEVFAQPRPDPTRPDPNVELTQGGQRPETSDPADARCTTHQGVADPPSCRGCMAARQQAERDAEREHAQRVAAARGCRDCGGSGWLEDDTGQPVAKCEHRRRAS